MLFVLQFLYLPDGRKMSAADFIFSQFIYFYVERLPSVTYADHSAFLFYQGAITGTKCFLYDLPLTDHMELA